MNDTPHHDPLSLSILSHLASLDRKLDLMFAHLTNEEENQQQQIQGIQSELAKLKTRLASVERAQQ